MQLLFLPIRSAINKDISEIIKVIMVNHFFAFKTPPSSKKL